MKGDKVVCWTIVTNPVNDMFRLDELYDERDSEFEYTEDEIDVIDKLKKDKMLKESGIL